MTKNNNKEQEKNLHNAVVNQVKKRLIMDLIWITLYIIVIVWAYNKEFMRTWIGFSILLVWKAWNILKLLTQTSNLKKEISVKNDTEGNKNE